MITRVQDHRRAAYDNPKGNLKVEATTAADRASTAARSKCTLTWRTAAATALVALLGLLSPQRLCACAFEEGAWFWLSKQPNESLDRFAAGHLGILDPALGRAFEFVAFRYLSGQPLDDAAQAAMKRYWQPGNGAPGPWNRRALDEWRTARRQVADGDYFEWIFPQREITRRIGESVYYVFYANCLDDAFRTATQTLKDRAATYGTKSTELKHWVAAQDQVFANCRAGELIPQPVGEDEPALCRVDREYQIAAAHFYAGHLVEAEERFRAIAHDPDSPWRSLAAYLVGRTLVRQATLADPVSTERLAQAQAYLRTLLQDDSLSAVHSAIRRLLSYAAAEADPTSRRRELASGLLKSPIDFDAHPLTDYLWLLGRARRTADDVSDELGDWIDGVRIESHWAAGHGLPWLVRAMMSGCASATCVSEDSLLSAAENVPPESPAWLTVGYHRARILIHRGRPDEARTLLDTLLASPPAELSLGDRNRLLTLRASIARTLDEFLRDSQMIPVGVGVTDGDPIVGASHGYEAFAGVPLFSLEAIRMFDSSFTPGMILPLLAREDITTPLRRRLAVMALARAIGADDPVSVEQLSAAVDVLVPEVHTDFASYREARDDERRFLGALLMLRFPGMRLTMETPLGRVTPLDGINEFRINWWCTQDIAARDAGAPAVYAFLSTEAQESAARMRATLQAIGSAPEWLGQIVIEWANTHPRDPRVPEALHRVVRATRFGCINDEGVTSKAAFDLLHRRYASSEWADKTPYWFK